MKWILFAVLFTINGIFYLLEISFGSFSRVSLAKFIKNFEQTHRLNHFYVDRYDLVFHALKAFVFFMQVLLILNTFHLLQFVLPNPYLLMLILSFSFLLIFNTLLSTIGYLHKEFIFKNTFFLFPLVWYVFYPFNRLFSLFIKDSRVEEKDLESEDLSNEEMEVFLDESKREGVIEEEDQAMIQSVLEFGDTLVKAVMSPRVDMVHVAKDASLEDIVGIINRNKKSRYPVVSEKIDNVEGVILAKDVFNYWDKKNFDIHEILRPPFFIPETMRIFELLKEMQKTKQQFAIVVDEFGGVSGIVTIEDLIEEIVGEIKDEYDDDSAPIFREGDHFLARGDTNVYELYESLGLEMDDSEEFQTAAGLISYKLGRIPKIHDRVRFQGWILEVEEIEKNRIKKIRISHETK